MDLETQLQHTGTDLANKLQRASTEVEEERGREQHRLGRAQREGWVTWTWVGDPEPHANLRSTGVPAKSRLTTLLLSRAPL